MGNNTIRGEHAFEMYLLGGESKKVRNKDGKLDFILKMVMKK